MSGINILPKNVAELIAAGEVIERPSSVIKELVENSIDSGAGKITVEIQNGGTKYMRVTDDGCGIAGEDVPKAFVRHATSKISRADDLDSISTLGFRGEALASVCAVSRVSLLTKSRDEEYGVRYELEGGQEKCYETAGCPDGTTIIVRDIFFNVPARMKFLKRDVSEGNAVSALMERIALSHPEISFCFIREGKQIFRTQGDGRLETAVYQIFGKSFFNSLIPVSYERNGVRVTGYTTKPGMSQRANRTMQIFFINGRFVRSKTAAAALERAYSGSIMSGKYPSCVLMLDMECSMLDVNVHPAKLEVRFTDERPVYECIYHGVRSSIMSYDTRNDPPAEKETRYTSPGLLSPPTDKGSQLGFVYGAPKTVPSGSFPDAMSRRPSRQETDRTRELSRIISELADENDGENVDSGEESQIVADIPMAVPAEVRSIDANPAVLFVQAPYKTEDVTRKAEPEAVRIADENEREQRKRYIGEAFGTYIIIEYGDDRLMFIDKHAAHERLIYEKLKKQDRGGNSQLLLEPLILTLDREGAEAVLENRELLESTGFSVDSFGRNQIAVRSIPVMLENSDIAEEFMEVAEYLAKHKKLILSEKMEWIYANTACRAAVKAGNHSSDQELISLAETLEREPGIRYCPHGRPIYFFMSKYQIEKLFGRKG